MQKLKNSIVNRMLEEHLTSAEINLLLYVSRYQDDQGRVLGIYYKDVCAAIEISYETFYTSLEILERKGFITRSKGSYGDSDITILNNDFTYTGAMEEGYINTARPLFYNKAFYRLKAGEKLLALQFFKNAGAGKYRIGINKLYTDFAERLKVKRRTLQQYLKRLKEFFSMTLSGGILLVRNKERYEDPASILSNDKIQFSMHIMRVAHRRYKISDPDELTKNDNFLLWSKDQKDTRKLIEQYWSTYKTRTAEIFLAAVKKSIEKINEGQPNKYKWRRDLKPKLIHQYMRTLV